MSDEFDIIKFQKSKRKRQLVSMIGGISILPISVGVAFIWPPLFFIFLIGLFIFIVYLERKTRKFDIIGKITLFDDHLIITHKKFKKKIDVKDIAGINLTVEMANQLIIRNVDTVTFAHRHLAYNIHIKCSLTDQYKFTVFNFKNSSKRLHSKNKSGFLDIIKGYSQNHKIRFWDETGGRSGIL